MPDFDGCTLKPRFAVFRLRRSAPASRQRTARTHWRLTTSENIAGPTQKQLSDAAGVSVEYVANVENEHSTLSKPETIRAMAAALNLDPDELFAAAGKIPDDIETWLEGDLKAIKQEREGMNTKR